MVGRACKYSKEQLLKEIENSKEEIKNYINKKNAAVWQNISKTLNINITPNAVYTYVKKNYNNCWNLIDYKKDFNPSESETEEVENEEPSEFLIKLCVENWNTIQPDHNKLKLQTGWTHIINNHLETQTNLLCTWIFDKNVINSTQGFFVTIHAHCKECSAVIIIQSDGDKADNNEICFFCKLYKYAPKYHRHNSKRPLSNVKRQEVGKNMIAVGSASLWQKREVSKLNMKVGDSQPSTLYNLEVLRKCKQEHSKFSNFNNIKCPVKSLENLKYSEIYSGSIHHISLDKFFVHYWSPQQVAVYNNYIKTNKEATLILDATGSLIKKINRPYGQKSGNIFLYQCVVHLGSKGGQIPVSQMISEIHSTHFIALWLSEWIRAGALMPKTIICDHSYALLGAITRSYTACHDLKTYMNTCFGYLSGQYYELPPVFIRVDFAHIMKNISTWEVFKHKSRLFKEFYMRAMVLLIKSYSLTEAEKIIRALLIVSNSKYNENISTVDNKTFLKQKIAAHDYVVVDNINNESSFIDLDDLPLTSSEEWMINIVKKNSK